MQQEQFTKQFIGGEWLEGSSSKTIENINPYDNTSLGIIQAASRDDVNKAYERAQEAFESWKDVIPSTKQDYFAKLLNVIKDEKDFIIDWLIKEAGSTRIKAESEYTITYNVAREAMSFPKRMDGDILPSDIPGKDNFVYRIPRGVVGVIGPWNFPLYLQMRSVAPALALGNTVVLKPASDTPVTSGFLIGYLFEKAGFPKGTVNVVAGRGSEIGDAFITHPIPDMLSFTGSTEVGSHLAKLASDDLKDTALELGGNNAMIILADADLDKAAEAAVFGKFFHQGQICMATNRIIVEDEIYDAFKEKFVQRVKQLQAGDPSNPGTHIGPVINEHQAQRIQELLQKTIKEGAKVEVKGDINGTLIEPTVLSEVTNDMTMAQNEIFGPVALLIRAKDAEEAVNIANDTPYGLSGAVFTGDRWRGLQIAKKIHSGMVHVNDQPVNDEQHVAFGGEKHSGTGRFGGEWALHKFTTVKWISVESEYREYPF